ILDNGAQLKLTGNTYSFCQLTIRGPGTKLIIPKRTDGRTVIHMDSPENCPHFNSYSGHPNQLNVVPRQAGGIVNQNDDATTLMILMAGTADPAHYDTTTAYFEPHFDGNPEWY